VAEPGDSVAPGVREKVLASLGVWCEEGSKPMRLITGIVIGLLIGMAVSVFTGSQWVHTLEWDGTFPNGSVNGGALEIFRTGYVEGALDTAEAVNFAPQSSFLVIRDLMSCVDAHRYFWKSADYVNFAEIVLKSPDTEKESAAWRILSELSGCPQIK
jgi:hypothetical protein